MNLSELLTAIKMDLGIYGLALPFPDGDNALYGVLKLKTLKTFSLFCPQVMRISLNLSELKNLQNFYTESIYEIPDIFGERLILFIRKVTPRNKMFGYGFTSPVFDGDINTYNNMAMTQASANLMSMAAPAMTHKFTAPNLLHLFNTASSYNEIDVEFALEHAPNMSTITPMSWDSFYELSLLDIKRFLYNTMKHYGEIQTAYGTINLKIDDWASAEADRKDMLEKWKDLYHMDISEQFMII
jgi:hypothetical protein